MTPTSSCSLAVTFTLFLTSLVAAAGDAYIIRGNERTLEEIQKAYAEIPPVQYRPPEERWESCPKPPSAWSAEGCFTSSCSATASSMTRAARVGNILVQRRPTGHREGHLRARLHRLLVVQEPGRVKKYVLATSPTWSSSAASASGTTSGPSAKSFGRFGGHAGGNPASHRHLRAGRSPRRAAWQALHSGPWQRVPQGPRDLAGEINAAILDISRLRAIHPAVAAGPRFVLSRRGPRQRAGRADPRQNHRELSLVSGSSIPTPSPPGNLHGPDQETDPRCWPSSSGSRTGSSGS